MARDSTESRFLEVLDRFGGPQHVQLVGELWDRAESRALLEAFLRELFPAELPLGSDILKSKAALHGGGEENGPQGKGSPAHRGEETGPQCKGSPGPRGEEDGPQGKGSPAHRGEEDGPRCKGSPAPRGEESPGGDENGPRGEESPVHGNEENEPRCKGSPAPRGEESPVHGVEENGALDGRPRCGAVPPSAPQPSPDRALRFGLVFFLCRPQSLRIRRASRQLREILRDVRERMPAGGAVIGVIMKATSTELSADSGQEGIACEEEDGGGFEAAVSALLAMLQSVFPVKSRGRLCSEVRASALISGQEESRRDIQRLACEALTAADELRRLKPKMKSRCFSWRRRRWKDHMEKEYVQEGTALTVLQYPNGDCAETTDA